MVDISVIVAALNSLKVATDIAKLLRESDLSLEKAELKLKLADLITALADAKSQFVHVQETLQEKEKRIQELEESFEAKDELVRCRDAYYAIDSTGNPVGEPYCLHCWETDHRRRQLVSEAGYTGAVVCTSCGHKYNENYACRK
jgi:hypothetical protein